MAKLRPPSTQYNFSMDWCYFHLTISVIPADRLELSQSYSPFPYLFWRICTVSIFNLHSFQSKEQIHA